MEPTTNGFIFGHAAAQGAVAVGAIQYSMAGSFYSEWMSDVFLFTEPFSSQGPRRVFFDQNNNPITPEDFTTTGGTVRPKPDFVAADGVQTSLSGFNPFYGTSAAAPHAAGMAANLLSYSPNLTPSDVRSVFVNASLDILFTGWDDISGYGILDAVFMFPSLSNSSNVYNGEPGQPGNTTFGPSDASSSCSLNTMFQPNLLHIVTLGLVVFLILGMK
jgi:subtilisin family serine protease